MNIVEKVILDGFAVGIKLILAWFFVPIFSYASSLIVLSGTLASNDLTYGPLYEFIKNTFNILHLIMAVNWWFYYPYLIKSGEL